MHTNVRSIVSRSAPSEAVRNLIDFSNRGKEVGHDKKAGGSVK